MSVGEHKEATEAAPLLPTTSPVSTSPKAETAPKHHALLGIACVACSALCFSLMSTFIKYETYTFSSMEAIFWRSVGAFVCNFSFYLPSTFLLWRAIIGCGICTFGGQMFLTKGFQLEKAGIASVMRYLDVVFVFIWDSTILGERINHWSVVGALIICSCAVTIAVRKMRA
ncbi:hypothetical protein BBJ28_00004538 [Nothophytophthora sp. Chile5]|nr:hypothetical protein BBJ28_00004538 [Nothophytophthora sp. Chile5]